LSLSSFLGLLLQLVEKLFDHSGLLLLADLAQSLHSDCDLLGSLEPLLTNLVQLHEDEAFIHFEHLRKVLWLKLWGNFASEKHSCLLGCVGHAEHALHLAWLVLCTDRLFRVERCIEILVAD